MRAVVQRVSRAQVSVNGEITGKIGLGLLVLLGVGQSDTEADAIYLAEKICGLRVFEDEGGKMNGSVQQAGGSVLAVRNLRSMGTCAGASGRRSMPRRRRKERGRCMNFLWSGFATRD